MKYHLINNKDRYRFINQTIDCFPGRLKCHMPKDIYNKFIAWDDNIYKHYSDLVKYIV